MTSSGSPASISGNRLLTRAAMLLSREGEGAAALAQKYYSLNFTRIVQKEACGRFLNPAYLRRAANQAVHMTYLKMISADAKKHLVPAVQGLEEITTLCGCTVTRSVSWKAVTALEGDECEKCAAVSFSATKLRNWLEMNDGASHDAAVAKQPK